MYILALPSMASIQLGILNISHSSVVLRFNTWQLAVGSDVPPTIYLVQYKLVEDTHWLNGTTIRHDDYLQVSWINQTGLMANTTYLFQVTPVYINQAGVQHFGRPSVISPPASTEPGMCYSIA